jgi:hypothetical protein
MQDDLACDRQPEPRTSAHSLGAKKRLGGSLSCVLRDPFASIVDKEFHFVDFLTAVVPTTSDTDAESHTSTLWARFTRVEQEIDERLFEERWLTSDLWQPIVDLRFELNIRFVKAMANKRRCPTSESEWFDFYKTW